MLVSEKWACVAVVGLRGLCWPSRAWVGCSLACVAVVAFVGYCGPALAFVGLLGLVWYW